MKKHKKLLIFVFLLFTGLFLNHRFGWSQALTDPVGLQAISGYVEENYLLSVGLYLLFTILGSSFLALPGVTFAIIGSGLFGPWVGSLYCLIGATGGATLSFLLSRYLLKDAVEGLVKKNKKLYQILFETDANKEMLILMITRLLPIFPFNLQNFAYGITNIPINIYITGTFLFMIPGIQIFSLGTAGILNEENQTLNLVIATILLVVTLMVGVYIHGRYKKLTMKGNNEE
ncbi:MAG: TVP38/TMEM64 family protein [Tissierellia bacterium]|nr:TVP38/TMEM64 family protein [Tissierellia bacterium]